MDTPDELIMLERSSETERAKLASLAGEEYDTQWRHWREAAETVQAAITEHAAAAGQSRFDIEAAVKAAVRHADEDPAV